MNLPLIRIFRLRPRGEGGLACDASGVALGAAELVRVDADATGRRRCETIPSQELERVLNAAYGPSSQAAVARVHCGLRHGATALEAGDVCLAGIETVLLSLPDLNGLALEKLAEIAKLEKWGTAWQDQPRVPAGQSGGGQWTADGNAAPPAPAETSERNPALPLDDSVYRPGSDDAHVILTGGAEEEEPSRGSTGLRTTIRVSKTCSPASARRRAWRFPWRP